MKDDDLRWREVLAFAEHHLGHPLDNADPATLSPFEAAEVLWPLNDVFRPRMATIRAMPYDPTHEAGADRAVRDFAYSPTGSVWEGLADGVWRVLLERHTQLLMVVTANMVNGSPVFATVPAAFPQSARIGWLALRYLYRMELPWPAEDRSSLRLPDGGPSGLMPPR